MMPPMNRRLLLALSAALCAASLAATAHDFKHGALEIQHPWARPTVAGQSAGGGYLAIRNTGSAPDRLLGGTAAGAASVELHEMRMDGDVMRMREIKALELPAGKLVTLAPGGLHLMLTGLKAPLKIGDKLPVKLRFEKAGEVELVFHVESKPAPATTTAHTH
jgi:copper(I)-binding protein